MPVAPPAGYLPERPCSTVPDDDSPPASPPREGYSRQNPFGMSLQQQPPEDAELNMRGGYQQRKEESCSLCKIILGACCCYALCECCC